MNPKELIEYYAEKKLKQELSKTEIRNELETQHNYTDEEVSVLMRQIYDYELILIQDQKTPIEKFLSSIYISYFFVLFAIGVICYTILVLQKNMVTALDQILPWIFICGAFFLIFKHVVIIYNHKKGK